MTIPAKKMCRRIAMFAICILISGWLAAQTDAAKNTNSTKPAAQTAAADPSTGGTAVRAHDDTYIIGADDVLAINVWKEPEVSRTVPVRSDGKISLPLAGEVQASGETPLQLEKELATKLQSFISEPEVTVIVTEIKSQKFNILGMVSKPGSYPLTNSSTVLDAIASGRAASGILPSKNQSTSSARTLTAESRACPLTIRTSSKARTWRRT